MHVWQPVMELKCEELRAFRQTYQGRLQATKQNVATANKIVFDFLTGKQTPPGNDVWQSLENVRWKGTKIFGQAYKTWRQGDGLPMQEHLVGPSYGGTHPCVG